MVNILIYLQNSTTNLTLNIHLYFPLKLITQKYINCQAISWYTKRSKFGYVSALLDVNYL